VGTAIITQARWGLDYLGMLYNILGADQISQPYVVD
jgi:hypothetical protein